MRMCDECGLAPAEVKIVSFIDGNQQTEKYLCKACAAKLPQKLPGLHIPGLDINTLKNLLGMEPEARTLPQAKEFDFSAEPSRDITCPHCGTTFDAFRESGLVGCSVCYDAFREPLEGIMQRIHGDCRHIGHVPDQNTDEIPERLRIDRLQRELEIAVAAEEYEHAANIRDKIRELRAAMPAGKGGNANA